MDSAAISPFLQNCQANSLAVSRFGADWSLAKTMMSFVLNGRPERPGNDSGGIGRLRVEISVKYVKIVWHNCTSVSTGTP